MAAFPSVVPLIPERVSIRTRNILTQMESGVTRSKNKWPYPLRDIELTFNNKISDAALIWQFYIARLGSYEAFNYFLHYSNTYYGEYVGTGDGSTTVFNAPSKSASGYTIYIDGGSKEETTDYTFSSGGGADGADKITFVSAPALGTRITMDFTGKLKIHCRFAEDNLDYDTFYNQFVTTGLTLRGELNA